jgi:hypothetical protein
MHEAAFYDCIAHDLPVRGRRNRTPLAECTVQVKKYTRIQYGLSGML